MRRLPTAGHALDHVEVVRQIPWAMREALQATSPTRTILGLVILEHAARLVNGRQTDHQFYIDVRRGGDENSGYRARQLASELPAYSRAFGIVPEQSAAALRERASERGIDVLRMFCGVHGPASPTRTEDASGSHYPMRALSSWSMESADAERFAKRRPGKSCVLEADVPVGCLAIAPGFSEEEVMLFPVSPVSTDRAVA